MKSRFSHNIKSKPRTNRRRRTRLATTGNTELSQINNTPIQTRVFRYYSATIGNATASAFTVADLLAMLVTCINADSTAVPLIQAFRLRRVGVSAVLSGSTGSSGVTFGWRGPNVPTITETIFAGVGTPNSRSYYPPSHAISVGQWYDRAATSVTLFQLETYSLDSGESHIYLDIDLEYILADGATTPLTLSANATYSGVAVLSLPLGSNTWIPLGLNTVHT